MCWNAGSGTHPVTFQGFGRVLLFLPKAVGTLRLMKDVGRKFLALRHGARKQIIATATHMSAVLFESGTVTTVIRARHMTDTRT